MVKERNSWQCVWAFDVFTFWVWLPAVTQFFKRSSTSRVSTQFGVDFNVSCTFHWKLKLLLGYELYFMWSCQLTIHVKMQFMLFHSWCLKNLVTLVVWLRLRRPNRTQERSGFNSRGWHIFLSVYQLVKWNAANGWFYRTVKYILWAKHVLSWIWISEKYWTSTFRFTS